MQTNEFIQIRIHFIAVYINILIEYGLIATCINVCKYARFDTGVPAMHTNNNCRNLYLKYEVYVKVHIKCPWGIR